MQRSTCNNRATTQDCDFDKLPTELVSEIFMAAGGNAHFVFQLSTVCRRWHSIAIGTPMLWSTLDVKLGSPNKHMTVLLKRSRNSPLTIRIERTARPPSIYVQRRYPNWSSLRRPAETYLDAAAEDKALAGVICVILPHLHRWKEVQVKTNYMSSLKQVEELLVDPQHAPQLRRLTISAYHGFTASESHALSSYPGPCIDLSSALVTQLQGLALSGVLPRLQSARLTNISTLHLDDCADPIAVSELLVALSSCPDIQQLSLSSLRIEHDLQAKSNGISLPHLHRLSITNLARMEDTIAILPLLRAPALRTFHLEQWSYEDPDILDVLSDAQNGYPSIADLSIHCAPSQNWPSFLQTHSSIERLSFADDTGSAGTTEDMLQALCGLVPDDETQHALPLTLLRDLRIFLDRQYPDRIYALVKRIRSARPGLLVKVTPKIEASWHLDVSLKW